MTAPSHHSTRRRVAFLLLAGGSFLFALAAAASLAQRRDESAAQSSQAGPGQAQPHRIFDKIIASLRKETQVPLRLPAYMPYSDKLYIILEVAKPDSYSIQLATLPDCEGGNACHVGYIGGGRTAPVPSENPATPVTLNKGIRGTFVDFDCGAHCDDASISWAENGYYYEISVKAGKKATLVRMANSAIGN